MATIARSGIRQRYNDFIERHEVAWELTMAALAVLFVVVGFAIDDAPAEAVAPLIALDLGLTGIFLAEFATRIAAAPDRRRYLRSHWIDALALIPTARGIRLLRLLRLLRLVRAFSGVYHALVQIDRLASHRGLLRLFIAWLGVAVISSAVLYYAEIGRNPEITEPFDALWWAIVTLATVGYGDVTPITVTGRAAGILLILLGVTLWAAITGTIVSYMLSTEPPPATAADPTDTLLKLGQAREQGLISADEFEAKKQELLARI